MEATPEQMRLFVAQAIYKDIAPIVSTKGAGPRVDFNDECMEKYVLYGSKTLGFEWDGVHVADTVINFTKPTESRSEDVLEMADPDAARAWALDNAEAVARYVAEDSEALKAIVDKHLRTTGELADGFEVREVIHPGEPRKFKSVTLKVDSEAILSLVPQLAPSVAAGLLTAGGGYDAR